MRKRIHLIRFLAACAVGLGSSSALAAQGATLGIVRGTVTDVEGVPLGGVRVVLGHAAGGGERVAMTARNGAFEFLLVSPGTWTALAERLGYRPMLVEGIPVRPAGEVTVSVVLEEAPPPVERVDTVTWVGGAGGVTAAGWYPESVLRRQPLPGMGLEGAVVLAGSDARAMAGLPTRMLGYEVNGVPVGQAVHPGFGADPAPDLAWPTAGFTAADYDAALLGVERREAPAGVLAGFLRRGPRRFAVSAGADWQPSGAAGSRFFTPGAADRTSWRGAVALSGPVIRDTADFAITVAAEDWTRPQAAPWSGALGADTVVGAARDAWGTDLLPWALPFAVRQRTARVIGHFDWLVAQRHFVSLTGAWGRLELDNPDYDRGRGGWLGTRLDGTDWHAGVSVVSRLGTAASEFRLGVSRVERDATAPAGGGQTTLVSEALRLGVSPGFPGAHARRTVTLSETLYLPSAVHRIAFGAGLEVNSAEATWAWGVGGDRFYADATHFAAGDGASRSIQSTIPTVRHTQVGLGLWLQDTWRAAAGLDLVMGARLDLLRRPTDAVTSNVTWTNRTGLDNAAYSTTVTRVSPRGALVWTPAPDGGWTIEVSGALRSSTDELDAFNELIAHDGRITVRRAVGALGAWPAAAGSGPARPRLAVLAPGFVPPRTGRAGLAITGDLGGLVVRLAGSYRHTDFLPRRTNLNRLPAPAGVDQHGRPLYGTLVQQGGLLAADPASGRRFDEFEMVSGLNADGAQDRWEGGVALERRFGAAVGLLVAYTYSVTDDNWLGARGGAPEDQLDPFPDGLAGQSWAQGVSDFDVPHTLVAAIDLQPFRGLRFGGLFQIRSGMPFTPGFRPGVDANADGSARNDPAYVDGGMAGMDALLSAWPCLQGQLGRFAARNACRMPTAQALDLWLRFDLGAVSGLPLALTVEARNLIEPDVALPDAALYLVDPAGAVTTNSATGAVTVPLLTNPNFGSPRYRLASARALWIGLRVND